MKLFKSNLMILASMLIFVGTVFAVENSRSEAMDNKLNAAKNKIQIQYKAKTILVKQNEPLSIGDPVNVQGELTRSCDDCEFDWSDYGAECCDAAWDDFGISCADLTANYGWDCAGCLCPGDVACEDQGLVTCDFDGSCAASLADCPSSCEDSGDLIDDCDGSGECIAVSWIGDGYCDGTAQQYGADLCCYDNDGGDCTETECGDPFCGDGICNNGETETDCPEDCAPSEACGACELDWSAYGSECCDSAWDDFGISCADLTANYGWDCAGCNCPGDAPPECGDGVCNGDETFETCPADCLPPGECAAGEVADCADDDCCPESWIGDGFEDCEDQAYGCDLTCYDDDGGDCSGSTTTTGGTTGGGEGGCEEGACPDGTYWDGFSCYDCSYCLETSDDSACDAPLDCCGMCGGSADPGACGPTCEDQGLVTCWDGSCAASEADCPDPGDGFVADCSGTLIDNANVQYAGDGDEDGDGCLDTVYDCVIDNGTCTDVAGNCYDAAGACTGETTCPDGVIGAWTNDALCDDGDFGLFANCEELCFDGGSCGTQPDPDCTIGDAAPSCPTQGTGDVNYDGAANVLDIVQIVNYILGTVTFDECGMATADLNGDGAVNVLDIVQIVNVILDGRIIDASSARLIEINGAVSIEADGFIGAVQMKLSHDNDFSIELTDNAMVAEYATEGSSTTLVVVAPESDLIFTSTGQFEVDEVIVANSSDRVEISKASDFTLLEAYPNPFNPVTTVSVKMPEDGFVSVKVYNLMGQVVATLAEKNVQESTLSFNWDASSMPSGVYVVRAEALGQVSSQKLMLLK